MEIIDQLKLAKEYAKKHNVKLCSVCHLYSVTGEYEGVETCGEPQCDYQVQVAQDYVSDRG